MTDPVVLRVHRPYADEDAYLAAESWTIDDKAVLLIDQPALPRDTVVRFEIVLDDGSKPVRAEGKVHKLVAADDDHPGGLKVRFRRFDAATKRFIDRVQQERKKERRSRRPPPAELAPLVLDPEPVTGSDSSASERPPATADPSTPGESAPEIASQPLAAIAEPAPNVSATAHAQSAPARPVERPRPSGGGSGPRAVDAPANRDELLHKLRARTKG